MVMGHNRSLEIFLFRFGEIFLSLFFRAFFLSVEPELKVGSCRNACVLWSKNEILDKVIHATIGSREKWVSKDCH